MPTCKWYLPTLAEVMQIAEPMDSFIDSASVGHPLTAQSSSSSRAQREWYSGITSLNILLDRLLESAPPLTPDDLPFPVEGIVISGPLPVLGRVGLIRRFSSWVLTGGVGQPHVPNPFQLLPAADIAASAETSTVSLPLLPDDPLGAEPFCLVLTREFSLLMALNVSPDESTQFSAKAPSPDQFLFSFTPEVVWQGWRSLRSRLELTTPHVISKLDLLVDQFAPITPDYRLVADFSRLMMTHFPDEAIVSTITPKRSTASISHLVTPNSPQPPKKSNINPSVVPIGQSSRQSGTVQRSQRPKSDHRDAMSEKWDSHGKEGADAPKYLLDAELLQAIAHEVRTPLSTIRTLTRLLLKRTSLPDIVLHRLEMIDAECTRQIDRFGLIFRAAELQEKPDSYGNTPLAKISLVHVLQQNIPQWQQAAKQRDLSLDVLLPKSLPMVLSDPRMLEQVLSGLMDQLIHALPSGSHIDIRAMPAGSQVKLQFFSTSPAYAGSFPSDTSLDGEAPDKKSESIFSSTLQSIGQLLMFQPETGNLSLNLDVTKNLFHALGGKFTIRQYPHQGEVLTIFLPLDKADF
ncbi:MAG: HAMP domain-containing sensor histidine kinase [Cyanobacteria bacterium P01_E01_bin.6]